MYDFPASPTNGQEYTPPVGGQTYIFQSPRWLVKGVPPAGGGGGGGIDEAPTDGAPYARQSAAWNSLTDDFAAKAPTVHTHAQADVTNLVSDLGLKAPLASPALTGTPTVPTATAGTNTTQAASTAFVTGAISTSDAAQATADNLRVLKAGDTMTGALTIAPPTGNANLLMRKVTGSNSNQIIGYQGANARWGMLLGNGVAESGGNAGSDFGLNRYDDAGTAIDAPITIGRSSGIVNMPMGITTAGTITSGNTITSGAGFAATTGNFASAHINVTLGTTGSGNVILRPNGLASATGQVLINSGGDLLVTGGAVTGANGITLNAIGFIDNARATAGGGSTMQRSINNNGIVGSIATATATSIAYNTTSDARLKENERSYDPAEAIAIIKADPVLSFTWKSTGEDAVGWFAQKSYEVDKNLATPPEMDAEGRQAREDDRWGIDYGRRTPYLWAAVTGLLDRIAALEARIAVLEAPT